MLNIRRHYSELQLRPLGLRSLSLALYCGTYAQNSQTLYRMNLLRHERETSAKGMTAELRNALLIHNPNAGNGGRGPRRMLDPARRIFALGGLGAELAATTAP